MSWYSKYRGQTPGRVLHFLYHYCGSMVAEKATVYHNSVDYLGRKIATYKWINQTDIPLFHFKTFDSHTDPWYNQVEIDELATSFSNNQQIKMFQAITSSQGN